MPIAGVPLAYMLQRGFDQGTLSSLGIQMSPGGDIAYVYYKNGERVDTKYRIARKPLNGEPKCRRDEPTVKGAVVGERCFYLRDFCDPSKGDTLVITAGEANTATLWMAGIKNNVVNGPDGESSIKWIEYEWDLLEKFKWITLWADQDEGGNNWVEKIVTRLGVGRVKVVQPPVQANDANESLYRLTKTHGREEALRIIREAVLNAVPLTIEDLYVLADIQPKEVNKDGDLCGIPDIDRVLGGFRPGLTTVSGDTGDGKSTGLRGFIAEFVSQKLPVFWWDGESRKEKSQERFDLIVAGPNYLEAKTSERTGATWYTPRKEVLPYIHNWYREFVHLYAPPSPPDILTLLDSMTQAFRRHGCKHFVIDNLMKLTLADKRDEYRVQAEIINKLKDFADEFGVHVMIVTHTKKDSSRPDAPPTTSDTKGAGEINKLADVAIAFWRVPDQIKSAPCMRNGEANMMYGADGLFIINKDRETGVEGVKIPLSFNSQATRFRGVNDAIQPPKDYGWVEAYEADKKSKLKVVPPPPPTQATKVTDEMQDEIDAFMSIAFPE
jgi:twinkle protein